MILGSQTKSWPPGLSTRTASSSVRTCASTVGIEDSVVNSVTTEKTSAFPGKASCVANHELSLGNCAPRGLDALAEDVDAVQVVGRNATACKSREPPTRAAPNVRSRADTIGQIPSATDDLRRDLVAHRLVARVARVPSSGASPAARICAVHRLQTTTLVVLAVHRRLRATRVVRDSTSIPSHIAHASNSVVGAVESSARGGR